MRKLLCLVFSAVATPAFAQPASAPATPQPLSVRLTVKVGADTRVHELAIFDNGCGRVEDKGASYEDNIEVCARAAGTAVQVEASWRTRTSTTEYQTKSAMVMPRRNSRVEVGRANGTRFTLQLL